MSHYQQQEPFRVKTTRNGRCTFSFGTAQKDDLVRVLTAALRDTPQRFPDNTPHLVERLKSGSPITQGDLSQLVKMHPELPSLSMSTDAALKTAGQKLQELSTRHHRKFLHARRERPSDHPVPS